MTGAEFIRAMRELGRKRGLPVEVETSHGKGSHVRIWVGERATLVKDRKKELPRPMLKGMLKDLGLSERDLP